MKNLLFLILFICSTWNIFAQQRVAPFSLGGRYIHKLDSCFTLTDSMNMEIENVAHNQSQQTQLGQLKEYVNANTLNIAFVISFVDTANLVVTLVTPQAYDDDGDSIKLSAARTSPCNFQIDFEKPNGSISDLASFENGGLYEGQFPLNVQMANDSNFANYISSLCYFSVPDGLADLHFVSVNNKNPIGSTVGNASPSGSIAYFQLILHK